MSISIAEAAAHEFVGDDIKVAEVMPTVEEWRNLHSSLWILVQVLNDDSATLTAKIEDMERQGMVQTFLDMLDSAHDQTKGLHGLMEMVRARVIVAVAKTVQDAEAAA